MFQIHGALVQLELTKGTCGEDYRSAALTLYTIKVVVRPSPTCFPDVGP